MKGEKIIANYNHCQETGGQCVCVHNKTKELYNLIEMKVHPFTHKQQMLFENSSGEVIKVTEDDIDEEFMLLSDWTFREKTYRNCVYPELITNLTDKELKAEIEKGEPIKRPIAYFKFRQFINSDYFIYECILTDPIEKINDTFIIRMDITVLYDAIENPVEVAKRFYNGRKQYLNW